MNPEQCPVTYPITETYPDGRKPLHELYNSYFRLLNHGWTVTCIAMQEQTEGGEKPLNLPIYAFLSPKKQQEQFMPSLWIIGGIHGEEPAPAHAFAHEIETIRALPEQGIPVVAIFVANPGGYRADCRYLDKKRRPIIGQPGKSVGDAEHLLPHHKHGHLSRKPYPSCPIAGAFTSWVLATSTQYYPLLVINHHEDEIDPLHLYHDSKYYYNFVYGNPLVVEQITPTMKQILEQSGHTLQKKGRTRNGERIIDGFVHNARDSSIDELLASPTYISNGKRCQKKPAGVVVTVETIINPNKNQTVEERARIHENIIQQYSFFYKKVQDFSSL